MTFGERPNWYYHTEYGQYKIAILDCQGRKGAFCAKVSDLLSAKTPRRRAGYYGFVLPEERPETGRPQAGQ
jgi:hypothetical protein